VGASRGSSVASCVPPPQPSPRGGGSKSADFWGAFRLCERVSEFLPPPLGEGRGGGIARQQRCLMRAPTPTFPQGGRGQVKGFPEGQGQVKKPPIQAHIPWHAICCISPEAGQNLAGLSGNRQSNLTKAR